MLTDIISHLWSHQDGLTMMIRSTKKSHGHYHDFFRHEFIIGKSHGKSHGTLLPRLLRLKLKVMV